MADAFCESLCRLTSAIANPIDVFGLIDDVPTAFVVPFVPGYDLYTFVGDVDWSGQLSHFIVFLFSSFSSSSFNLIPNCEF